MTIEEIKELIQVVRDTESRSWKSSGAKTACALRVRTPLSKSRRRRYFPCTTGCQWRARRAGPSAATEIPTAAKKEDENHIIVKSPIVGTYYDSPSPGAPAFVKPGDRVEPKTVLCIIESMKLMNEIEAEIQGIVVAKHLENGRPVEYGESLFTIQPI